MPLVKLLGEKLLSKGGLAVPTKEALQGASAIGLYFSASWCPPCRGFTPQLVESYSGPLAKKGFKCVLISRDRDTESFGSYFGQMPWLALPFEDQQRNQDLGQRFGVQTIPSLALVDPEGNTITTDARNEVVRDPQGEDYPWRPPLVRDLAKGDVGRLNEQLSVVLLCEAATEAQQQQAFADLVDVAESSGPAPGAEGAPAYFVAPGGPLAARIRELCGLQAGGPPQLVLLDIPDQGGFYAGPAGHAALDGAAAKALVADYRANALQRRQLAPS